MKRVINYIVTLTFCFFLSCNDQKTELSKSDHKFKLNDTTWCVEIGNSLNYFSLLKHVRENNAISRLFFFNSKRKVIISEMYTFNKNEGLATYTLMDNSSKPIYSLDYDNKNRMLKMYGNMNTYLDSIAFSKEDGYVLFYTYPRMPYYHIKSVFYLYKESGNVDSIVPFLKNNCHILLKVGQKLPVFISPVFDYEHFFSEDTFKLGWPSKLDTIKRVPYPKQLDLFYTKEIDYSKYPFVKEN